MRRDGWGRRWLGAGIVGASVGGLFAVGVGAQPSARAPRLDHRFTLIEVREANTQRRPSPREPWQWTYEPRLQLKIANGVDGDFVRVRWKKGRRVLDEVVCEVGQDRANDPRADTRLVNLGDRCWTQDRTPLTQTGRFDVEISYIDDTNETETPIGTLHPTIAHHFSGFDDTSQRHIPRYHVVQDDLLGLSWMDYDFWFDDERKLTKAYPRIHFWTAPKRDYGYRDRSFRCSLDGQMIPQMRVDALNEVEGRIAWEDERRGPGGEIVRATVRYQLLRVDFPDTVTFRRGDERLSPSARDVEDAYYFMDHPGEYECRFRIQRDTVRTFRFKVDDRKFIVDPIQQGSDFMKNTLFLRAEFPARNDYEHTFAPAAIRGSWGYGQPWPRHPSLRSWFSSFPRGFEGFPEQADRRRRRR